MTEKTYDIEAMQAKFREQKARFTAAKAAGMSEADSAHAAGWATRKDLETHINSVRRARGLSKVRLNTYGEVV